MQENETPVSGNNSIICTRLDDDTSSLIYQLVERRNAGGRGRGKVVIKQLVRDLVVGGLRQQLAETHTPESVEAFFANFGKTKVADFDLLVPR